MKMVPAVYRGVGAFLRKEYRGFSAYADLVPQMEWLLHRWHMATYEVLEKVHVMKPAAPPVGGDGSAAVALAAKGKA